MPKNKGAPQTLPLTAYSNKILSHLDLEVIPLILGYRHSRDYSLYNLHFFSPKQMLGSECTKVFNLKKALFKFRIIRQCTNCTLQPTISPIPLKCKSKDH